jgi:ADP-L-glycero-D-manno-heptose 6-epimerase
VEKILVTGGAGFIGSALVWELNRQGYTDIIISDRLNNGTKWKNLVPLKYKDYFDKEKITPHLLCKHEIDTIFHLGACSSTTEKDTKMLMDNNYSYSIELILRAVANNIKILYASSAATYGFGECGFDDCMENIELLRPLNMYGYSKHLIDLFVKENKLFNRGVTGLKYFNVFGPNEYHKGDMRSMICKSCASAATGAPIKLFKSYDDAYTDGNQLRDFLYVKDAVKMTIHLAKNNIPGGLFNIGSGESTTWNSVATYIFNAIGKPVNIEYIDMPPDIISAYQYNTKANISKFLNTGYNKSITNIDVAIEDYITNYLCSTAPKVLGHYPKVLDKPVQFTANCVVI